MRAPKFWFQDNWMARALTPLSVLWNWGAEYRQSGIETFRPEVPVICIGNIVAGGTGKTPVVLELAKRLQARGRRVHILTRGYGGRESGPLQVDPNRHSARQVGDEALLLAQIAPTWVARWRPDGAAAATKHGADVILMDDGFQNFTIAKDLSLIVVDGPTGFGNGRIMPAGPCREPILAGRNRAQAAIIIGPDDKNSAGHLFPLPIIPARLAPDVQAFALTDRPVLAFAGIGRPEKFFAMLQDEIKAQVVDAIPFADHHAFSSGEIETLLAQADLLKAELVTTLKDWVRIPAQFRDQIRVVHVTLEFAPASALDRLLDGVLRP